MNFTQSSVSSSSMLGISTTSSLRANLPRIRGLLSASVFLHAYFFVVSIPKKNVTTKNKVIKNLSEFRKCNTKVVTLIVLVKFLWFRLALYFEIFSLRSSALYRPTLMFCSSWNGSDDLCSATFFLGFCKKGQNWWKKRRKKRIKTFSKIIKRNKRARKTETCKSPVL